MTSEKTLVFIYNADSNPFKQAFDFFKRMGYPQTYPCNLTKITHDKMNMKQKWQSFIQVFPVKIKFYHRDMFKKKYPDYKTEFPIALLEKDGKFEEFMSVEEINGFASLEELIKTTSKKLLRNN